MKSMLNRFEQILNYGHKFDAGEQSRNVNVVHTSMVSLDTSIQRNAAMVEESAASAQNLQEQARELQELVQTFKC